MPVLQCFCVRYAYCLVKFWKAYPGWCSDIRFGVHAGVLQLHLFSCRLVWQDMLSSESTLSEETAKVGYNLLTTSRRLSGCRYAGFLYSVARWFIGIKAISFGVSFPIMIILVSYAYLTALTTAKWSSVIISAVCTNVLIDKNSCSLAEGSNCIFHRCFVCAKSFVHILCSSCRVYIYSPMLSMKIL